MSSFERALTKVLACLLRKELWACNCHALWSLASCSPCSSKLTKPPGISASEKQTKNKKKTYRRKEGTGDAEPNHPGRRPIVDQLGDLVHALQTQVEAGGYDKSTSLFKSINEREWARTRDTTIGSRVPWLPVEPLWIGWTGLTGGLTSLLSTSVGISPDFSLGHGNTKSTSHQVSAESHLEAQTEVSQLVERLNLHFNC